MILKGRVMKSVLSFTVLIFMLLVPWEPVKKAQGSPVQTKESQQKQPRAQENPPAPQKQPARPVNVKQEKKVIQKIEKKEKQPPGVPYKKVFVASISAYTASAEEGTAGGVTASGRKARIGRTVAAARHIPLGTRMKIEGLPGVYTVEDRGGAIKGNKIDLFVKSKAEARKWGRQHRKVYILH